MIPFRSKGGIASKIRAMFSRGEQGLWLDPSDLTTMFQDSAGTTPVTAVEQPVGLILDKSKGLVLGPELLSNPGAPFAVTTGWSGNVSVTSGALVLTATGSFQGTSCTFLAVSGQIYKLSYSITSNTANWSIGVGNGIGLGNDYSGPQITTTKTGVLYFKSTATGLRTFWLYAYAAGTVTIDNISVRELPGNHAFQSTSANRPTLSARYNLLTKSEDFSDAGWSKNNATAPNAYTLKDTTTASFHYVDSGNTLPFTFGVSYTFKVRLEKGTIGFAGIHIYDGIPRGCSVDLATGQIGTPYGGATATSIADGTGWILTVTATAGVTTSTGSAAIYMSTSNALVSYTGTGTGTILVSKADLRVTNDALNQPAYQRVNTATDYDSDTTKFPWYLKFNGTSSSLQTASINFTATDKMFVSAGVRKLSDAASGAIFEISTNAGTQQGSFNLFASGGITAPSAEYQMWGTGTTAAGAQILTYAAPITNIVTQLWDISQSSISSELTVRVNGITPTRTNWLTTMGTGNFGNYQLYIGARAGTSLFFNGNLYQLVVRGAQATASEIAIAEAYVNAKTKAY